MEVKPGYKQTEVGVIPEEWEVAPLSREIERLEAGVSVNSVDEELRSYAHEQAVLKTSAIARGQFLPNENKKIDPRDIGRAKLNPRFDTIIISRMNTPDLVGECGYVFAEFPSLFLPDRLWMTRNRNGSDVCVRWLNYLLTSKPYKTRIKGLATGTSGSMKNIAKDALLAMLIQYPDGDEQRAIAGALSDVDALLGALDRLIAKKRDLKQAAMQQLLTGQTRLPGFRGEWEKTTLGEIGECVIGLTYKPEDVVEHGLLVLRSSNIQNGRLAFEDNVYVNVKVPDHLVTRTGDILICVRNGSRALIGKCAVIDESAAGLTFGAFMSVYRTKHWRFIAHAFQTDDIQRQIRDNVGATINQITNKDMKAFRLKLPSEDEQTAIAEVLTEMDTELAALEQRREKTCALKQAMMQELLTGKTRLV